MWPSDVIWHLKFWFTFVQIMAWYLTAPSHYLNQCWLHLPPMRSFVIRSTVMYLNTQEINPSSVWKKERQVILRKDRWTQASVCNLGWWKISGNVKPCCVIISHVINSLCAKFFRGNINIRLHFMSLLHIDMTQVLKILPRKTSTYIFYIANIMAADVLAT